MKRMLFNATFQEELRVASVEGQKLINFDIETSSKTQRRGNIYCGVITRVEQSLEACFVDYGTDKQGFLPFKEIDPSYIPESARYRDYSKLTEGTKLIVQVEKDERGNKGAALTTYISLPGRYLVLMTNNSRSGGISRRIDGEERDELKAVLSQLTVPNGMSIIARTAALGRAPEELQWDLNYLLKLWDAIRTAAEQHDKFLIYQESNLVIRSIRDHFSPDITEVLIDEENIYQEARNFMLSVMPAYVDRIKLYHDDVQLFSRFQIEHQIESAYSRTVNLPSGGAIVIDHTEALTSVDVNSARANKGADIEATALATNLEASEEIARQMRLRDLGGLVVVDFIDMENPRNQREVENFFKQQLGLDRARIQMGKLSKFGLLELSRQRLQASLEESTTIPCPRCTGIGVIRGTESIAVHILRIIQEEAVKNNNYIGALHVQLPVEVATYLLNEKRDDVAKIENRMKVRIVLIPNTSLESPHYKIRKISNDNLDALGRKLSYNLVENFDEQINNYASSDKKSSEQTEKAVVRNIAPSQPAPIISNSIFAGVFLRVTKLFKTLFGNTKTKETKKLSSKQVATTKRAERENLNANKSQAKTPLANKVRPVPINKTNTKVQTVRPSNSLNKTAPQTPKEVLSSESNRRGRVTPETKLENDATPIPKHREVTRQELKRHNVDQIEGGRGKQSRDSVKVMVNNKELTTNIENKIQVEPQVTKPVQPAIVLDPTKNNSVIERNRERMAQEKQLAMQEPKHANISEKLEEVNLVKPREESKIFAEIKEQKVVLSTEKVVEEQVANVDAIVENKIEAKSEAISEIKIEAKVIEEVKAPEIRRNTILDSVDLGELQIVSTNMQLANEIKPVELSLKKSKRYNDVVKADDSRQNDLTYELVETKQAN